MRHAVSINKVFWLLLACSFALALTTAATAVWVTAKPFLMETHKRAVISRAKQEAARVYSILDPSASLTVFLASEPSLVSYVIGDVHHDDGFIDRLEGVVVPENVSEFFIFDFEGTPMSFHRVSSRTHSLETTSAVRDLAAEVLLTQQVTTRTVDRFRDAATRSQDILIAAPILNRGFVEGVLTSVLSVDLGQERTARGQIETLARIVNVNDAWSQHTAGESAITVPIGSTGLSLVLNSQSSLFQTIGQELVTKAILAVSAALLLPFGIFGWLGRQTILRPHAEVERSRNKLREQQKELSELAAIARKAEEAIVITDLDTRIVWHNPAFERISGHSADAIKGRLPADLLQGPDTDPQTRADIRAALAAREPISVELINYRSDEEEYWVRLSISTLFDDQGQAYGFMAISSDVSEQKHNEKNLIATTSAMEWQALHDELTGLPNRRCFNGTFDKLCAEYDASSPLAIIRIDLDHFKNVNDTMGHEAGDKVLCQVSQVLRDEISQDDIPVRIGGDEFIVLLGKNGTLKNAQKLAQNMLRRVSEPIEYEGKSLRVGASFGIASSECNLVATEELVRAADAALYIAKERGRNQVITYGAEEHKKVVAVRDTAELIRLGLERGEFVPFYQPQIDAKTHDVVGVEVLARWVQPDKAVIPPSGFLEVAEQLSMLTLLDRMVMKKALDNVAELERAGTPLPKVSFNVTAGRLSDPDLLVAIDERDFTKTKVSFEILESVFLDDQPEYLDFTLDLLREKGLLIEIDDFGSGHASMISLMRVRPDVLKIDQRLVYGAPQTQVCQNMVRSIIGIAESLQISVTAEGVETYMHADMMQSMGCATLQGFHFAEPMSFEDLKHYIAGTHRAQRQEV
ncbi:EAL domain-containing protein [Roseobacter sp. YSTF-M11]|uniref:EAL domain-containing protein n=1 Tax=Roseobacter insulae TaxID=2859783 RepID=A0A9X1JYJ6_9RHOB|nr:EAL domain-containing protein [Roseobacter insulae]MBW4708240.1 EAL domain-containing protein [Roseobacter insulae]